MDRRTFLRTAAAAAIASGLHPLSSFADPQEPKSCTECLIRHGNPEVIGHLEGAIRYANYFIANNDGFPPSFSGSSRCLCFRI
jgi:hypothetical protein